MVIYTFDGTFDGFLSAIYDCYYRRPADEIVTPDRQSLLFDSIYIETDQDKSAKVYDAVLKKISPEALRHAYFAFLSELPGNCTAVYNYLKLGFKTGRNIDHHLHLECVRTVHDYSRKVSNERHRMLGLLRFTEIQHKFLYAPFEPDHNIISLLASHFAKRLASEHWIIHDIKRQTALIYNTDRWVLSTLPRSFKNQILSQADDCQCTAAWKQYFDSAAIAGRANPRSQLRSMPRRYWKYLPETN